MTTTWAQAAEAKAREALHRLQRELDAARIRLDELRDRLAAVERTAATVDPDADPDLAVAVQVAAELLPALVAEAETAVTAAMAARREARAVLLPMQDHVWSRISAARQADARSQGEWDAARLHLAQLQRGRAAALATTREAGPGSDMGALAAAQAELAMTDRLLPAARHAVAAAEETAQQARSKVEAMEAKARALRVMVVTGEPEQAEAALAELLNLVGEERSGSVLR